MFISHWWTEATSEMPVYLYQLLYKQWMLTLVILLITIQICSWSIIYGDFLLFSISLSQWFGCVCAPYSSSYDFQAADRPTFVRCCLHHLLNNVESKSRCSLYTIVPYVSVWAAAEQQQKQQQCVHMFWWCLKFGSRASLMINALHGSGE